MTKQNGKDAYMEKVAPWPDPVVGEQLRRPGLNASVGIDYPGYQSEPEHSKGNMRKICEQQVIDVIFHVALFYISGLVDSPDNAGGSWYNSSKPAFIMLPAVYLKSSLSGITGESEITALNTCL